jgi:hypothetical protein
MSRIETSSLVKYTGGFTSQGAVVKAATAMSATWKGRHWNDGIVTWAAIRWNPSGNDRECDPFRTGGAHE